ncbi:MAG TPA: restriction endonuclease subunit S, partial [Candidatus Obscuribacterales bacterium]
MGNYQGYQQYKDSGVEWLGDIPEHWIRSVFRYYFDIQLGKMLQNEPQSLNDDEIYYLKAINVRWDKVDTYELPKMWASPRDREKYYVKNGDLLICEGGEVGRTALLKELQEDCIIQNALHRVRPLKQSSVEYLNYLMRHIADTGWFDILCNKSTIAHLTSEKVGALALPLPPLHEQQKIAQFLDYKTKQIDELIKKKETLIEKLDEK